MAAVQLWGGLECTVNRTGDAYLDQTRLSGHHDRAEDLDLFAAMGIAALRYPVLWERVWPDRNAPPDWRWTDARLTRLRALGIRPIAGLVHHGSGPRHTHLLDDDFAAGLGRHAAAVARRYAWIEEWTPVNEPLTTARFSALYGHWYPHARDERSFWVALLNQIDGTRAAMRAIRDVHPGARLVQTDDLGRTYATTPLADQAAFDNLRRWAGWDLLFGRVTPHHPLWEVLARHGLSDRARAIADDPCPPDIVGVNHYLTSDRFLDHRLNRYPPHLRGGNGRVAYADTEAIRVLDPAPAGLAGALREAWDRYRTPIAITEVHNGCTREEQLRWAAEAWDTAVALRSEGVDMRAVTAWALLGSHGWNTLLTGAGRYEPGVYDTGAGRPRPTALAELWRSLPTGAPRHPVAAERGWWRRPQRLIYGPLPHPGSAPREMPVEPGPGLLICGVTGRLGGAIARACAARGIRYVGTDRAMLDLGHPERFDAVLDATGPWAVVNAAGWSDLDVAERAEPVCARINAAGAAALAARCAERGIGYLGFSSDMVFDGRSDRACLEDDATSPANALGRVQAAMERGCATLPGALIVRTAALFGPHAAGDFAAALLAVLDRGTRFAAADDRQVTPTYRPAMVEAALDLLIDGVTGIRHLVGDETLSEAAFARRLAIACGHDPRLVEPVPAATLTGFAPHPLRVVLASRHGAMHASLADGIAGFARARHTALRTRAA